MRILIIEPFYTGSHKAWADGWKKHSNHQVDILSLPGRFWKWRMYGAAVTLAREYEKLENKPHLIVATDMLDLNVFLSLIKIDSQKTELALYFHENQLTYPWSETDSSVTEKWDKHYAFNNFTSCLCAEKIYFNSLYHKESFISALSDFLAAFPDYKLTNEIIAIENKSEVLYLGMDLKKFDAYKEDNKESKDALILWNHRWEYDKNPDDFFKVLFSLKEKGIRFKLAVLGESYSKKPEIFTKAKEILADNIVHWGYAESFEVYAGWLQRADILPVTSNQDFFGGSIIEAMYCDTLPLLPKRLAYPEHIPESLHSTFFFDDYIDLEKRLQKLIFNLKVIRNQSVKQYVSHYDWSEIIEEYDQMIDK